MGKRIEVKFKKTYVASRGASIAGAKGETKTFAESPDLDALLKMGIVKKVKDVKPRPARKTPAATRKKATRQTREKS